MVDTTLSGRSSHEADDQLELYALDRLFGTELIRVEEHLFVCERCRSQLEQTDAFANTLRDVLKQHPEPDQMAFTWRLQEGFENLKRDWLGSRPRLVLGSAFAALVFSVLAGGLGLYRSGGRHAQGIGQLAAVASLQLTAMRGETGAVRSARELDITLSDAPASGEGYRLEVVDDAGRKIWDGKPYRSSAGLEAKVAANVLPGVYFARLYDSSGKLLHEYGFRAIP